MNLGEFRNIVFYGKGKSTLAIYNHLSVEDKFKFYWLDDASQCKPISVLESLDLNKDESLLIASPGVPLSKILMLRRFFKSWLSALEFELLLLNPSKTVAITGSAGKTMTAELLTHCFNSSNMKAISGGNNGVSFLTYPKSKLSNSIFVVEISSYQLEHHQKFTFDVAVLTSLFENHLKRHQTMEKYVEEKSKVISFLKPFGLLVLNIDHPFVDVFLKLAEEKQAKIVSVSDSNKFADCFIDLSSLKIFYKSKIIPFEKREVSFFDRFGYVLPILEFFGIAKEDIKEFTKNFTPPKYRLEVISENPLVINDSKSTTLASTIRAIKLAKSLTSSITLVIGGRLKTGDDLSGFKTFILESKNFISRIICFGESAPVLTDLLKEFNVTTLQSLKHFNKEKIQGSILFSPGCESFDEFSDFEERGEFFSQIFLS